ncbi:Uma2 family endonuclease [Azospirillum sp. B2RO_4]|uniref:Uma2 family endonuclease n=1 Tax=Azospirillum sp. B2RO_4 TaxID=3027796 RepID=UPI003DA90AFE
MAGVWRKPWITPQDYLAAERVVEVLSDSTEAIDRREKRTNYQKIPSLREIVLVSQTERLVEVYRRDGAGWTIDMVRDGPVMLAASDLSLPLDAVYED